MAATLVTIGDSLTQGFQSGSISKTAWSYPAMLAKVLGAAAFRIPDFAGEGGLPLNLERLVRRMGERAGSRLDWFDLPAAAWTVASMMDATEDYWERGPGDAPSDTGPMHHNLAVWGFEMGDCNTLSDAVCRRNTPQAKDQFWTQNQIPEFAMYRTARRTLNPGRLYALEDLTQLDLVERIAADEGGIDNLVVALGANNVLGTCTSLTLRWSQSADCYKLAHQRNCNIWAPEHFQRLLDAVVARLAKLTRKARANAPAPVRRLFIANVPHVTIAPVTRGISPDAKRHGGPERKNGFYEYYTHFWVWDDDFIQQPNAYRHLTREDARTIDGIIDDYNRAIVAAAKKHGWHVIDFCDALDRIAFRRNDGEPTYRLPDGLLDALEANPATRHRVFTIAGDPRRRALLDTRYLRIVPDVPDDGRRHGLTDDQVRTLHRKYCGGLFSLDAIHPTTIGYGIIAHEVLKVMQAAGVPRADPDALPWADIVAADSLVVDPPRMLHHLQHMLGFLASRAPLARLIRTVSGFGSQEHE